VRRRPGDAEARFYYGITLAFLGDYAGALREYDEAIRLDPAFADPYYYAYSLLGRAGQLERAAGYLQQLLQVNPQEQEAQALLRQLLPRLGSGAPTPGMPGMPAPSAQP
jgi:Tetratricopeptide repeat.